MGVSHGQGLNPPLLRFFESHHSRGRVALVGAGNLAGRAIREGQRLLTPDGRASLWSHVFILGDERPRPASRGRGRVERSPYIFESDLEVHLDRAQVRNGAQESWVGKWCGREIEHAAVLDFGLSRAAADRVIAAALRLVEEQVRYPLGDLLGTWIAIVRRKVWEENPLKDPHAMYCSAFVRWCFREAGRDFLGREVHLSNTAPEHIAQAREPIAEWHR
ncbi:MAG: hypothetical protein L0216_15080 [Planctomycetales bacterium]|nr:hypothetical protein [Planctomycetales bacterium]